MKIPDIWAECRDKITPGPLSGRLTRVVESQEVVATHGLVDSLEEQALLEEMLEQTKPPRRGGTQRLHWLLATPFRYPPLPHGSRFGSRFEGSLFYGSLGLTTAFAETAYYRFLFWHGMKEPAAQQRLLTQHTVFKASYKTSLGLELQQSPFDEYEALLVHRNSYEASQRLGASMREAGIEAFQFVSARDRGRGINVALFSPAALVSNKPIDPQPWLCETTPVKVSFYGRGQAGERHEFAVEDFMVAGVLPEPAL